MHLFSVSGTVTVILWGAAFGCAAALLRVGLDAAMNRWAPRWSAVVRIATFDIVCLALALVVLTPWTVPRLVLFPPVVLGFLIVFEIFWVRGQPRRAL
jgi:hypothetical protein